MGNKQDKHSSNPAGSQVGSSHANNIEEPSFPNQPPPSLPQSSNINRGPTSSSSLVRSTSGNLNGLPGSSHIRVGASSLKRPAPPPPSLVPQSSTISRDSSSSSSIIRNTNHQNVSLLNTTAQSSLVQRNDGAGAIPKRYIIDFNFVVDCVKYV